MARTAEKKQDGRKNRKWRPVLIVEIYKLLRAGIPQIDVCKHLDVSKETFNQWLKKHPELREAVEMAKRELDEAESFADWVFKHLPHELREVWRKIENWETLEDGVGQIESMLCDQGKRARQQLFLHALCVSDFSPSTAMRRTHVSKKQLDAWCRDDPDFSELMAEIQWHKANFFEESLVKLVKQGVPAAVVFANKTYNKDRGYAPSSTVDVNVSGQVMHGVLDLSDLLPYLSQQGRLELLDAIRQKEEKDFKALNAPVPTPEEVISHQIGARAAAAELE